MGIKVHTGESNGHSPGGYYKSQASAVVDVNSEESIQKWCKVLDLSRSELLQAIEKVGPEVRVIRLALYQSREAA